MEDVRENHREAATISADGMILPAVDLAAPQVKMRVSTGLRNFEYRYTGML